MSSLPCVHVACVNVINITFNMLDMCCGNSVRNPNCIAFNDSTSCYRGPGTAMYDCVGTMDMLRRILYYKQKQTILQPQTAGRERVKKHKSILKSRKLPMLRQRLTTHSRYCFGGVLICRTKEQAKKVAFDPSVRRKCITLDGDVYDPAGRERFCFYYGSLLK